MDPLPKQSSVTPIQAYGWTGHSLTRYITPFWGTFSIIHLAWISSERPVTDRCLLLGWKRTRIAGPKWGLSWLLVHPGFRFQKYILWMQARRMKEDSTCTTKMGSVMTGSTCHQRKIDCYMVQLGRLIWTQGTHQSTQVLEFLDSVKPYPLPDKGP